MRRVELPTSTLATSRSDQLSYIRVFSVPGALVRVFSEQVGRLAADVFTGALVFGRDALVHGVMDPGGDLSPASSFAPGTNLESLFSGHVGQKVVAICCSHRRSSFRGSGGGGIQTPDESPHAGFQGCSLAS